jgi:ABC-type polysaccharide/polyol phosphate transport system ATPase subunit
MAASEPAIIVDDVSKRFRLHRDRPSSVKEGITKLRGRINYDDFWAVEDISLEIPEGSMFGIIGHNGSGKSSLLRLMAGIHRPTKGSISIRGRVSALLELGAGFHPDLTGRENVFLNASILGLGSKEIGKRLDHIVGFAGLEEFIDSPVKVYSSGMLVRLGFSVAIHVDPDILLLDEVIAVGDEEFQRTCLEELARFSEAGVTIVVVSHDLGIMRRLCDHAAWMDHGHLVTQGYAVDVVDRYLSEVNRHEAERLGAAGEVEPGTAQISDVEFLGPDGDAVLTATVGEPLTIRTRLDVDGPLRSAFLRLVIYDGDGVYVAEPRVAVDDLLARTTDGRALVDYQLDSVPLRPGHYPLTVIVENFERTHTHHRLDHAFTLQVQPGGGDGHRGIFELGGRWAHD